MASSLIRGKYVICKVTSRTEAQVIEDGAVFQQDGKIVDVGKYKTLASKHRPDEVFGSAEHLVLPGFVNSHHHTGLTTFQMGEPDKALELRWPMRIAKRDVDAYLDTLYSAFEMIESGVTTVQHLHSRAGRTIEQVSESASRIIQAYRDIGMRASYSYLLRDQNRLVYEADEDFVRRLPSNLAPAVRDYLQSQTIPLDDNFSLFEDLHKRFADDERIQVQLAPANLHWCSEKALTMVKEYADKYEVPIHLHLLESPYQREYARRRTGTTAIDYLNKLGLLGPSMTLGHAVWVTEEDIELAVETGTRICHNASSNLRLRSGIAPVNRFAARGARVAIGIDEAGINEDRDMLQEMRLVLNLHRVPGMDDDVPASAQVLQMATEHGAHTTPFGDRIGTLEVGKAADLSVSSWKRIAYPYLDREVPIVDAVVQRARASGVETVLVAGEPVLRDGRFTKLNKAEVMEELVASLRVPLRPDEERRRELSRLVLPHCKRFYDNEGYLEEKNWEPFYPTSSRV